MSIRYDDTARCIALSVRDLAESGPPTGHLVLDVAQTRQARFAAGRAAHLAWQQQRTATDPNYRAEVSMRHTFVCRGWTVTLSGRADGMVTDGARVLVEEIKSTAMSSMRLLMSGKEAWPDYVAQLEGYLWILAQEGHDDPRGELVVISLYDGTPHTLDIPWQADRIDRDIRRRIDRLIELREARVAWFAQRRDHDVPVPFASWRAGQQPITDTVLDALDAGRRALVQAPTGLGKTAAVLHGALTHAFTRDRQVFWCTSRNTQLAGVRATLDRFRERGLPLRWVGLRAKDKVCLNDVVACHPESCRYARNYFDKVRDGRLVEAAIEAGGLTPEDAMEVGRRSEVCPYQLAMDTAEHADVVVGDVNYAFSPGARLSAAFSDAAVGNWVVVTDEAHQLVERARSWRSPRLDAEVLRDAVAFLSDRQDIGLDAFVRLSRDALDAVLSVVDATPPPYRDGEAVTSLDRKVWRELAQRIDDLALDYGMWRTARRPGEPEDAWIRASRAILSFASAVDEADSETAVLAAVRPGAEALRLVCLDPSRWMGPAIARLGGWVGCSATLEPAAFHRDLLGLPDDVDTLDVPSPFPPDHLQVLVAPRVSTAYRDRHRDAEATAKLIQRCIEATPGNVAVYFPSFAMLRDIAARWDFRDRTLRQQSPGMREAERTAWIRSLTEDARPTVLAAVLGGVFAEGVDLPTGALSSILIAGPSFPPVGLERDLLREHYEDRYNAGFAYASLVPAMTRVVQASGRLIRRTSDRGVLVLVGRRFGWRHLRELLPRAWQPASSTDPARDVASFWEASP